MLRFYRCLTMLVLSVLLLSGCLPVLVPVPIIATPAEPTAATADPEFVAPPASAGLTAEPLFTVVAALTKPRNVGSGELGIRYVSDFTGGAVNGTKLAGTVLPDGEIWYLIRRDNIAELLIRGAVQTEDGALITFCARAFSRAAPLTTEQLFYAELIDPSDAFFRGVTFFETDAGHYDWLNHAVTIATYSYDLHLVQITVYAIR